MIRRCNGFSMVIKLNFERSSLTLQLTNMSANMSTNMSTNMSVVSTKTYGSNCKKLINCNSCINQLLPSGKHGTIQCSREGITLFCQTMTGLNLLS
jgi:hypothetical protein